MPHNSVCKILNLSYKESSVRKNNHSFSPQSKVQAIKSINATAKDIAPLKCGPTSIVQFPLKYPYTATGIILSTLKNGSIMQGTGCLIGTNLLLTAAHNAYHYLHQQSTSIQYVPAPEFGLQIKQRIAYRARKFFIPIQFKSALQ